MSCYLKVLTVPGQIIRRTVFFKNFLRDVVGYQLEFIFNIGQRYVKQLIHEHKQVQTCIDHDLWLYKL